MYPVSLLPPVSPQRGWWPDLPLPLSARAQPLWALPARSKQGSDCRVSPCQGIPSRRWVTSESRTVSQVGWVGWHHRAGTVQLGLARHRR